MAYILSTVDTTGQLTGTQARVQNRCANQYDDFVVDNHGSELACTQNGTTITVGTGMAMLCGTLMENTAQAPLTFALTGTGFAMVIAKINLLTKIPTVEIKAGTTLTQNDLISNSSGTREIELYRITYANSVITGFTDMRVIRGRAYNPADLVPVKNAGGMLATIGLNSFYVTSNTALTGSYPQTMPITKRYGGLAVGSNLVTLTKGYLYRLSLVAAHSGDGSADYKIYSSANAEQAGIKATVVTGPAASGWSPFSGQGIIDLTGAGSNLQIKLVNVSQSGSVSICTTDTVLMVDQLLPVAFANL